MRRITKLLAGTAGLAALAAAAPAAAQYYDDYSGNDYYGNSYSNGYYNNYGYNGYGYNGYGYGGYVNTAAAAQQCTAAVQNRLYNRTSIASILGSLVGINTNNARVLSVTAETPSRYGVRVDGLATSGNMAYNNYSPFGIGAYGALGYGYAQQADLSFICTTDANGYVRSVRIYRR